jgi:hypothetical protein
LFIIGLWLWVRGFGGLDFLWIAVRDCRGFIPPVFTGGARRAGCLIYNLHLQSYPQFCHAESISHKLLPQTTSNKKPFKSLELWKGFSNTFTIYFNELAPSLSCCKHLTQTTSKSNLLFYHLIYSFLQILLFLYNTFFIRFLLNCFSLSVFISCGTITNSIFNFSLFKLIIVFIFKFTRKRFIIF